MGSPSLHTRPLTTHSSQRITGPQPVTYEKQYQLQLEREQQIRLMIEKEQRFIDQLRSEIAVSPNDKKSEKLVKAESNLQKLHTILQNHVRTQNESPNHTHHRTKSSPDSLCAISPAEASRRLIASESMNDLSRTEIWESAPTPPGTPPPPYPSPVPGRKQYSNRNSADDCDLTFEENIMETSLGLMGRVLANSSPIHAATSQTAQQPIISMEDDEISDPEVGQLEDHGPFKSLSRLWEHTPHLAVFMNYVLSNSDPSSLLFYLITDLYKEGNAKEMRKWAFEIHSSFLVPGAHLRLSNVDENIAREIDDVLTHEFDKEEILRRIFWKARTRAKEELTRQLADFQQKRTAGLGTIFGPNDAMMAEISQDKAKEVKLYESLLLDKLDPYLDELDRDNYDPRRYLTAAALATVITRVFGVRPAGHALDRFPTFVNKEKSFRTKFIGRYSRKLILLGHQFVAQPYFTVIPCNHCHQIISGIAPQGYQCAACLINLHRLCVKLYDDTCPGPINKKDRGIGKLMDRIHSRDHRRKPSANFIQMEKERRLAEERDAGLDLDILGKFRHLMNLSVALLLNVAPTIHESVDYF
ncbi:rho guanine nucleotide exchange factor 12-like isoform X3 [Photinus pyralis]|uniref:rho guanine nucleotide exchange factor 12-like isoform X3 n=1 Tax=Photinus pyralis TaxID=7054 RepID=UPI001266FFB0|nr:rho guanine nucleotide exchange factor 12-like isoform X3 [Photinus pyralis]